VHTDVQPQLTLISILRIVSMCHCLLGEYLGQTDRQTDRQTERYTCTDKTISCRSILHQFTSMLHCIISYIHVHVFMTYMKLLHDIHNELVCTVHVVVDSCIKYTSNTPTNCSEGSEETSLAVWGRSPGYTRTWPHT